MAEIQLSSGNICLIDDVDLPLIEGLTIYEGSNGYVYFSQWLNGKSHPQTLHRFLMQPPGKTHVDHRNGNKLDNRRGNLRVTTPSINQANRQNLSKANKSGMRGVAYRPDLSLKKPWYAQIMVNRKQRHLGLFGTVEEAIEARKQAEVEAWGELCPTVY